MPPGAGIADLRGRGMADRRAGSIFASSFIAGLLLTAGIFAPRAWEPVPEPYFGLEEPAVEPPARPEVPSLDECIDEWLWILQPS